MFETIRHGCARREGGKEGRKDRKRVGKRQHGKERREGDGINEESRLEVINVV